MSTAAPEAPTQFQAPTPPPAPPSHEERFKGTFGKYQNQGNQPPADPVAPAPTEPAPQSPDPTKAPEAPQTPSKPSGKEESIKSLKEQLQKETLSLKEQQEKYTQAETRIKELEEKAANGELTAKQYAELQKKTEEREQLFEYQETQIAAVNLQASTVYQNEIQKPLDETWSTVDEIVSSYKLDAGAFDRALGEPDRAKRSQMLEELVSELPAMDKADIVAAHQKIRELATRGEKLKEKAVEAWAAVQKKEQETKAQADQKRKETYKGAFGATKSEMLKKHDAFGNPEIANRVFSEAEKVDPDSMSEDLKAFAVQAMYAAPEIESYYKEKIAQLEKERDEYKAAITKEGKHPGPSSPSPSTPPTVKKEAESAQDIEARWKAKFGHR